VIVLDANLLVYAYDALSPKHREALDFLERVLSGDELVGIPWQTVSAFLRIVSNPRLFQHSRTIEQAVKVIEFWLEQPNVRLLSPGDQHWSILRKVLIDGQVRGPLVSDAQLAALTMEYGGVLYSTDRDFARFAGLRWKNPLEENGGNLSS
jgi:toxin-antitoxin system PIN domain toxin